MRKIVHLSDIHFGRIDYAIVKRLTERIGQIKPDLTVVSGDLTQRARTIQFVEARAFLDSLPQPQIVVPGNHDVPLYNVLARFAAPLEKYKKYITCDLQPFYLDDEIAALGINTARSLVIKGGRINQEQIQIIRDRFCDLKDEILKIVVTHHPFDLPAGFNESDIVGRARMAIERIADCGADLFLAGHIHISHIGHTATRYRLENRRSALVVQAGTATSTRGRGEANSFNLIEFEHPRLIVKRFECQRAENGFIQVESQEFLLNESGWTAVSE